MMINKCISHIKATFKTMPSLIIKQRSIIAPLAVLGMVFNLSLNVAHAVDNAKEMHIISMNAPKHLSLFDPTAQSAQEILYQNIYEGLVRYGGNGNIVTGLAQAWSHNEDYSRWTFELRRNVFFHDGARLTAKDVVFTFRNLQVRNLGVWNKLFEHIDFVKKDSMWRVMFILKRPVRDFLAYLARPEAVIVNAATWFNNDSKPNGTGPYVYSTFEQGKQLALLRNHAYWDSVGGPDKIVYAFNHPIEHAVKDVNMGKYHGIIGVKNVVALEKLDTQRSQIISNRGGGILQLVINQRRGALAQHPIRVAIAHALDRNSLVKILMPNHASPAQETVMAYDSLDSQKPRYEFSLQKARDIVNRAGYAQGLSITITLKNTPHMRAVAGAIKAQIERANIGVILMPIDEHRWHTHIHQNKDFEMALTLTQGEFNILDYVSPNYFNYHNDEINTLVDRVIASESHDSKMMAMGKIQSMIADDAMVLPLIKMNYVSVLPAQMRIPNHSQYRPQILFNDSYIEY